MQGLGNIFDICVGINPVADLAAGANTGKRIHLANYQTVDVLLFKNAASAGTDTITPKLRQHTANTGGTSADLAAIKQYYVKSAAAALAGTEAWTEVLQTASATITLDNTALPAANQGMVVFSVEADSLDAGYAWISVDIADPGSGGTILGGVFYIPSGLKLMRRPDLLAQPNA